MRPKKSGKRISTMCVCIIRFYQIYHLISIQHYFWENSLNSGTKHKIIQLLDQFDFVYKCLFVYKYIDRFVYAAFRIERKKITNNNRSTPTPKPTEAANEHLRKGKIEYFHTTLRSLTEIFFFYFLFYILLILLFSFFVERVRSIEGVVNVGFK